MLQPLGRDDTSDEARVVLCEVYRDQAGVDEHAKNPRLATTRDACAPMLEDRRPPFCAK